MKKTTAVLLGDLTDRVFAWITLTEAEFIKERQVPAYKTTLENRKDRNADALSEPDVRRIEDGEALLGKSLPSVMPNLLFDLQQTRWGLTVVRAAALL